MENILNKPYTNEEYADFAIGANSKGQRLEFFNENVFALYDYEEIKNGQIEDLSQTEEYKLKIEGLQKEEQRQEIQKKIDALDFKSIRATREGGIKDVETGKTWVEYYIEEIALLREQLASL